VHRIAIQTRGAGGGFVRNVFQDAVKRLRHEERMQIRSDHAGILPGRQYGYDPRRQSTLRRQDTIGAEQRRADSIAEQRVPALMRIERERDDDTQCLQWRMPVQQAIEAFDAALHLTTQDRHTEILLGREMRVQGLLGDTDLRGDGIDGDIGVAMSGQHGLGMIEDRIGPQFTLPVAQCRHLGINGQTGAPFRICRIAVPEGTTCFRDPIPSREVRTISWQASENTLPRSIVRA